MSKKALFIRALNANDKASTLAQAINNMNTGMTDARAFQIDPQVLRQVPGSPFAYWVSENFRRIFTTMPAFDNNDRTVRVGVQTGDDFRFVRCWWEIQAYFISTSKNFVAPSDFTLQTYKNRQWIFFAKGGAYSPFNANIHLLVNWKDDGEEIRNLIDPSSGILKSRPQNTGYYCRKGLTWAYRTHRLCLQELPQGVVISVRGSGVFASDEDLLVWLAIGNSRALDSLVKVAMGREGHPQFDQGDLKLMPYPVIDANARNDLKNLAEESLKLCRQAFTTIENSIDFILPALLRVQANELTSRLMHWQQYTNNRKAQLDTNQREIDRIALELYGLTEDDIRIPDEAQMSDVSETSDISLDVDTDEPEEDADDTADTSADTATQAAALISYLVGCAFGRWDIRFATGERPTPALPEPFAPLPACSPGMLISEDGLPLKTPPAGYPLAVDTDGILSDDPTHTDDIVKRVREGLDVIFGDAAEHWERDLCDALGVSELRDYLRKGAFWNAHIKRYSKSRRKAPIYWLLQSPKKHYGLWLYLHRLDRDTLFKALVKYAEPKLRGEEIALEQLTAQRAAVSTPREQRQADRDLERQHAVIADVREFCERLRRAADLGLTPDLNDGVVLTIAPLRELVPWKDAARYWDELRAGKYPWSSIAQQMREKGLLKA